MFKVNNKKNQNDARINFFNRGRSGFIQTRNLWVFDSKIFKELKQIATNIFPNILISMPGENHSPSY